MLSGTRGVFKSNIFTFGSFSEDGFIFTFKWKALLTLVEALILLWSVMKYLNLFHVVIWQDLFQLI